MAVLPQTFTQKVVDPAGTAQQLPLGDHPMVITASEMKQVKDKPNCGYLQLSVHVIDGPAVGMDSDYKLNLYHTGEANSEKVVEIAERQLSAIAHVTGNTDPSGRCTAVDSSQFHNIPFIGCVGPQKSKPEYTQINAVKHIDGSQPGKSNGASAPSAPVAPPVPPVQQQAPVQQQWAAPAQQQTAPVQQQTAPQWGNQASIQQQAPVQQPVQQNAAPVWAAPIQNGAPAQAASWGK